MFCRAARIPTSFTTSQSSGPQAASGSGAEGRGQRRIRQVERMTTVGKKATLARALLERQQARTGVAFPRQRQTTGTVQTWDTPLELPGCVQKETKPIRKARMGIHRKFAAQLQEIGLSPHFIEKETEVLCHLPKVTQLVNR